MNFVQPLFLFGLFAVVIPVIIHLFDFRRTKKVFFSNTKLLFQVKEATRSFYNLKHLLILLTRILFIIFLVGTFAQPYLTPDGGKGLKSSQVGIYIDNSLSMSNIVEQDETGLGLSKRIAQKLIDLYPLSTQFIVQTSYDEKSTYSYLSNKEAVDYINNLGYTSRSRPLNEILSRFNNNLSGIAPEEILMLSDFQRTSVATSSLPGDTATRIVALPIAMETYYNVAVDTAYVEDPLELDATKRELTVKIKNYGDEEVSNLPIKIFMDERQLSVTSVSVEAGERAEMTFNIGTNNDDHKKGRILLEDYPVSFDNEFFFSLQSIDKIRIVQLIDNNPGQYITSVFGNDQLFIQQTTNISNIDYQAIEDADLIILNQINEIYPGLVLRLKEQIDLGASLLIIPGKNANVETFRLLINNLENANPGVKISIQAPDFTRPFFKNILERNPDNISMPSARVKWSWGSDRNALLKLIDGSPYLSEVVPNIFVIASPLEDEYSDFQTNALFVPVMYRIANNRRHNITPLFYRLNTNEINLPLDGPDNRQVLKLVGDEEELIPEQRIFGNSVSMMLPGASMKPGHYLLTSDVTPIASIALNANTLESDLSPLTESGLSNLLEGYNAVFISGANFDDFEIKIRNEFEGIELWRYFLAIALLFLLIEALLIRIL